MSSVGRRNAVYVRTRKLFQTGNYLCWICGQRPGTTVDHDPPLSTFPHPNLWKGRLRPACQPCQSEQGKQIANTKRTNPTRHWHNPNYP